MPRGNVWSKLNKEIYNREASWGERNPQHFYERFYSGLIRDFFGLNPHFALLDLGCGDCFYLRWFVKNADAFGQDIASKYLEGHLEADLRSRVKFGDASQILFPDSSFDGVFLNHVIEHIDHHDVSQVLAEVRRVLRSGGKLFVGTPNRFGIAEIFVDLTFQQHRRKATGHANIMTPGRLRGLLQDNGFEVQRMLSRSVLCYPSGLPLPWIGRFASGFGLLSAIAHVSERAADAVMRWDMALTSKTPLLYLGFDLIALCGKRAGDDSR
jgi:SAM-dependent methyltransferase